MIEEVTLKFGRAEGLSSVSIDVLPITVFVGPNNSGKSKVLNEIQQFCASGSTQPSNVIVESMKMTKTERELIDLKLEELKLEPLPNQIIPKDHILIGKGHDRQQIPLNSLRRAIENPEVSINQFCTYYLRHKTVTLNGSNRINLIKQQAAGNLQQPPHSSFQTLFRDDTKRKEVRRIIYEAIGQYLVIDPTNLGHLNLRLSKESPTETITEIGVHKEAIKFHSQATPVNELSDGVKAFAGMITEMVAGDPSVLLIDEPEAFLHPPLAFKLGKEVAAIMSKSDKRLFVSTHSSNFIMGCIQSGAPVNIVRLTYRDNVATARILPNEDILKLMRNPLLRSTGVLSGLFYEFIIVTESDADRAFYQEINDRLLAHSDGRGIPNCLFLHAQNKQTVKTIIKPLRELGIPVAGIVDIDILKEGGSVWSSFLESGFLPEIEITTLAHTRIALKRAFENSGKNMKRDGGINILGRDDKEAMQNFISKLANYGLFVVPNGELESWLKDLNATGHGPNWLIEIFEKMGEDPNNEGYVKPDDGDVWRFINLIANWFLNPNRKGIPE